MKLFLFISIIILSFAAKAQNVIILDANFKSALLSHDPVIDLNGDNEIQLIEAAAFDRPLRVSFMAIADLTGIESFTSLDTLLCNNNLLSSLDLSNNAALKQVDCNSNQLTNLNISNNTLLTYLDVNDNNLTSLNVDYQALLSSLICALNQLTNLDVSNNTALTYLYCSLNPLLSLDVSNNTALTTLYCSSNQLTVLDVSNNTALTVLYCNNNQLANLDVNNNTALTALILHENLLTNLDVSNNLALTRLDCSKNPLSNLDVSNNIALTQLDCYTNQLSDLDVSNNINLTLLSCSDNDLTDLDVSHNLALTSLFCSYNQLTNLDVSINTALTSFSCLQNLLTSVNVANGNNTNFIDFRTVYNPNLMCIQVDNVLYSASNWTGENFRFDNNVNFSEDCGSITAPTVLTATVSISPLFITLNWTDNATNESGFKIERSTDGTTFSEIENVTANSIATTDNNVLALTTYYYRIYAYNAVGNLGFSNVVQVTTGTAGMNEIKNEITKVYPNPANSILTIETKEKSPFKIVNLLGKTVIEQQLHEGNNVVDVSNLAKGIYLVENAKGSVARFVKE